VVIDRVRAFALPGFVFRLPGFLALGRVTDVENEGNLCGVTTVNNVKKAVGCIGGLLIAAVLLLNSQVMAAETKIGVIDMKQVLSTSTAGKRAQDLIEQKMKTLQASFKNDETALVNLQKEIEKKGSAWSDSVKQEKAIEFQKKRRDLAEKQETANQELKKLREQHVNPILKKLEEIVDKVATDGGYSAVLPRNVVLFAADSIDISDKVVAELNKAMK
jgi:outer membrane protein